MSTLALASNRAQWEASKRHRSLTATHKPKRQRKKSIIHSQSSLFLMQFALSFIFSASTVTSAVIKIDTKELLSTSILPSSTKSTTQVKTTTEPPSPNAADLTSHFFVDPYFVGDSRISSYKLNVFYNKYKPEVGIRIASVLGSILLLIILYILWQNRCRCCSCSDESNKHDEEMAYWLNRVENKNKKNLDVENRPQQLPITCSDSNEATAAWVIAHRKIWNNAHHKLKHKPQINPQLIAVNRACIKQLAKKQRRNSNSPRRNRKSKAHIFSTEKTDSNNGQQQAPASFVDSLLTPFRSRKLSGNKKKANYHSHLNFSSSNRHSNRLFEELDTNTQLLINYARIDAIDASHNVNFNKLTGGLTFIHHNISNNNNSAANNASNTNLISHTNSPMSVHVSRTIRKTASKNQPLTSSSQFLDESGAFNNSGANSINNDEADECDDSNKNNQMLSIIKNELSTGRTPRLLQEFLTSMVHKRRSSWPRCRADHLQFWNYCREIRLFYNYSSSNTNKNLTNQLANEKIDINDNFS